jgi:hypothetical protein
MNLMCVVKAAASTTSHGGARVIRLTIVRDEDAPTDGAELTVVAAGALRTVFAGTGSTLTVDAERSEIFAFLAPCISADRFVRELLPLAVKLLAELGSA